MSTLSPVADPIASMGVVQPTTELPDVELPDPLTTITSVPDPTGGSSALNLLDVVTTTAEGHTQFETSAPPTGVSASVETSAPVDVPQLQTAAASTPASDADPQGPNKAPAAVTAAASSAKRKKPAHPVNVQMATAATAASNTPGNQGENTGRWTAEEHQLFLQGLEIHGKGWKKIAGLIKSRTVVQIRTHAQKYFQKLAKAKQNGEEGEVMMEGRGVPVSVAASMPANASSGTGVSANKRRKHSATGTKRKAISSVVASAQRRAKKSGSSKTGSKSSTISVAPVLETYVLPARDASSKGDDGTGIMSGPILEDALFRFLTPVPVANMEPQVNDVARQAGANPITLPQEKNVPALAGGEISPTGVTDWVDPSKDMPSWFAKGADVDALFDVADTLDWLADTGDLNENYDNVDVDNVAPAPVAVNAAPAMPSQQTAAPAPGGTTTASSAYPSTTSMSTLPRIDSGVQVVVPPLPSLFDGGQAGGNSAVNHDVDSAEPSSKLVLHNLDSVGVSDLADPVFDTHDEEAEFVSTILD